MLSVSIWSMGKWGRGVAFVACVTGIWSNQDWRLGSLISKLNSYPLHLPMFPGCIMMLKISLILYFWATFGGAQVLLLALCTGIISEGGWETNGPLGSNVGWLVRRQVLPPSYLSSPLAWILLESDFWRTVLFCVKGDFAFPSLNWLFFAFIAHVNNMRSSIWHLKNTLRVKKRSSFVFSYSLTSFWEKSRLISLGAYVPLPLWITAHPDPEHPALLGHWFTL